MVALRRRRPSPSYTTFTIELDTLKFAIDDVSKYHEKCLVGLRAVSYLRLHANSILKPNRLNTVELQPRKTKIDTKKLKTNETLKYEHPRVLIKD